MTMEVILYIFIFAAGAISGVLVSLNNKNRFAQAELGAKRVAEGVKQVADAAKPRPKRK